jgi:hypothetical protein
MLSGQFDRARGRIGALTSTFPAWDRGVCLREVFRRRVTARAPQGVVVVAAGAVALAVLGVALYYFLSSRRPKKTEQ